MAARRLVRGKGRARALTLFWRPPCWRRGRPRRRARLRRALSVREPDHLPAGRGLAADASSRPLQPRLRAPSGRDRDGELGSAAPRQKDPPRTRLPGQPSTPTGCPFAAGPDLRALDTRHAIAVCGAGPRRQGQPLRTRLRAVSGPVRPPCPPARLQRADPTGPHSDLGPRLLARSAHLLRPALPRPPTAGPFSTVLVSVVPRDVGPWPHFAHFSIVVSRRYRFRGRNAQLSQRVLSAAAAVHIRPALAGPRHFQHRRTVPTSTWKQCAPAVRHRARRWALHRSCFRGNSASAQFRTNPGLSPSPTACQLVYVLVMSGFCG